jgi:hypothetical protein
MSSTTIENVWESQHQRASYASGDFDAKYIPGIEVPIPGIARFQFTVLSSFGIPNSLSVNFELALT